MAADVASEASEAGTALISGKVALISGKVMAGDRQ